MNGVLKGFHQVQKEIDSPATNLGSCFSKWNVPLRRADEFTAASCTPTDAAVKILTNLYINHGYLT